MSTLDAVLAAKAHAEGRAQRRSAYRHRHLVEKPIAMAPWHLGAEPFTYAALAYGTDRTAFALALPGEPRDRRLLFPATVPLARWFNELFEAPWVAAGGLERRGPLRAAPQVIVPNEGAVTVLRKLGRRFAYLPTEPRTDGPPPADPVLVRFGRHLQFLGLTTGQPGRQLVVTATTLAADGWATEQNVAERANLAALDAWIDPPPGLHGFDAASEAEDVTAGPLPTPDVEQRVNSLIEAFRAARDEERPAGGEQALRELSGIYRGLSEKAWKLMWRAIDRERAWQEEPRFLPDRWLDDVDQYDRHMNWMNGPAQGRRRTRETVRQALVMRRQLEAAATRLEAEEAISDPLRLVPYLLDNRAFEGELVSFDASHKEVKPGRRNATSAPLATVRTGFPCLMPVGKVVWSSLDPAKLEATVEGVRPDPDGPGSLVTVKFTKNMKAAERIKGLQRQCFTELTTSVFMWDKVPDSDPWTHRLTPNDPASIEDGDEGE